MPPAVAEKSVVMSPLPVFIESVAVRPRLAAVMAPIQRPVLRTAVLSQARMRSSCQPSGRADVLIRKAAPGVMLLCSTPSM